MKQFTEIRTSNAQFAHLVKTKQLEFQIGEMVITIKCTIRNSKIFEVISFKQYDKFIIETEVKIRHRLIGKHDKNLDSLLRPIKNETSQLCGPLEEYRYINDFKGVIEKGMGFLGETGFLKFA